MRNHEVGAKLDALYALVGYDAKVSYAIAKCRPDMLKIAREVAQRQQDAYSEPSKKHQEAIRAIARQFARKDGDGKALTLLNGEYDIPADVRDAYAVALKVFETENADAVALFKSETDVVVEFLNADVDLPRYKLPFSLVQLKHLVYDEDGKKVFSSVAPPTSEIILLSEIIDFDINA